MNEWQIIEYCDHLDRVHFLTFANKCHNAKFEKRDGHGKSRYCHGKIMEKRILQSVWEP